MSGAPPPPPPLLSPDGRYSWDGTRWVLVPGLPQSRGLPRSVAILVGVAVGVMALGGVTYLSMLTSGPPDLNCIGQTNVLAAVNSPDGTLGFQGSHSPDSLYYTAPFAMAGNWSITWESGPGELTIILFDASAKAPWHSPWNPQRDNETGRLGAWPVGHMNTAQNSPYSGSALESRTGKFCLSVSSDAAWTITIRPQ
jgi:hypothetical protein